MKKAGSLLSDIKISETINNKVMHNNKRRAFLKKTALSVFGTSLVLPEAMNIKKVFANDGLPSLNSKEKLKLGVATYSLRNFSRPEAISMIREIGAEYVNIKSFHLPMEYTPEELLAGCQEFKQGGLEIIGGGTISMKGDDDKSIRSCFEYARICSMPMMVIATTPETLPRIEKYVKEYDIKVAIHNHGPEDPYFPAPKDVLGVIENMDSRVGICNDLGHTARTGANILESITESGSRLFDIHLKDLTDLEDNETQCSIGEGKMPVAEIFYQLALMRYQGYINLEYEIEAENPLEGMKRSYAYMKGVVDGIKI
ncbi:MAG: sugar phosphate isomerase/epimerase [Balneolales bacterium]